MHVLFDVTHFVKIYGNLNMYRKHVKKKNIFYFRTGFLQIFCMLSVHILIFIYFNTMCYTKKMFLMEHIMVTYSNIDILQNIYNMQKLFL